MEEFSMFWIWFWVVFSIAATFIVVSIIISIVRAIKGLKSNKSKKDEIPTDYVPTQKPTFPNRIDSGYGFDNDESKIDPKNKSKPKNQKK